MSKELIGYLAPDPSWQPLVGTLSMPPAAPSDITVKRLTATENGVYQEDGVAYSPVTVDVPGLVPSGTLNITENGTYDVTEKAAANISVRQWDAELKEILDGSATSLSDIPSNVTKIGESVFYLPVRRVVLPAGYRQVEYVEDGNVSLYVPTGVRGNCTVEIVAQANSNRGSSQVLLCTSADGNGSTFFAVMSNKNWGAKLQNDGTVPISGTTKVVCNIKFTSNGTSGLVNGAAYYRSSSTTHGNLTIFNNANRNYRFGGKVWSVKVWQNDVLVRDMVPVIYGNLAGFYDLVGGSFYEPVGGELTSGNLIESTMITSADLPSNVTKIGAYAFYNNAISAITLRANQVVTLGDHALDGTPIANGTGRVRVNADLVDAYKVDSAWSEYAGVIEAIT